MVRLPVLPVSAPFSLVCLCTGCIQQSTPPSRVATSPALPCTRSRLRCGDCNLSEHAWILAPTTALVLTRYPPPAFAFCSRQLDSITVEDSVSSDVGETLSHHYGVLAVLEFNSFRKRQSVIVQMEDGSVRLYCKGADNVIFARLGPRGGEHMEATRAHLQEYGNDGLRTLCLAYRCAVASDCWRSPMPVIGPCWV